MSKAAEADCAIIGGHSIRNPEPIYGLAVTGMAKTSRLMTNAKARDGDFLVLTKPLGTGIATTAIKRGVASRRLARKVVALMCELNSVGSTVADAGLVRAATDVTGFGLIGHLANLCRASGLCADVDADAVPAISREITELIERGCVPGGSKENLYSSTVVVNWKSANEQHRILLTDAQTSGGLLLCVPGSNLAKVSRLLRTAGTPCAAVIGRMVASRRDALICMMK